jgi:ADP-ribosylglycohydrolase
VADDGLSAAIRAGLVASAAGDALGSPWAGRGPREVRGKLTPGVTTDTTAQLVIAAEVLVDGVQDAGARFAQRLSERAVAAGWAVADPMQRRAVVLELGRSTHAPMATYAGILVADLAAWALEARPLRHATADAADGWYLPRGGVPASARGTLEALLRLVHSYELPRKAVPAAVRLGGDTATLAALTGAITGPRDPYDVERLPWLGQMELPAGIDGLAQRLAQVRNAGAT